jgi:serine/threonine protein kinase
LLSEKVIKNYLHSQMTDNTHDNLKASNILLSAGVTKLTDFGLSASIANQNLHDHSDWCAPEVLESKLFSFKIDQLIQLSANRKSSINSIQQAESSRGGAGLNRCFGSQSRSERPVGGAERRRDTLHMRISAPLFAIRASSASS